MRNEFDDITDIARLHRVRSVPAFFFFVGGAQVGSASLMQNLLNGAVNAVHPNGRSQSRANETWSMDHADPACRGRRVSTVQSHVRCMAEEAFAVLNRQSVRHDTI